MEIINKAECLKNLAILDNEDLDMDVDPDDYGFDNLEEMKQVILNAFNGQMTNGLDRINDVREYIIDLIGDGEEDEIFEFITRNYDFEDHPETLREAEEEYDQALKALTYLAKCLELDEFKRMGQFIPPSEHISIKNIVSEKRLPEDMEREVLGFMGKTKITGGKRRKSKKSRKSKKQRKTTRKHKIMKTRKRNNRKYKKRNITRV